MRARLERGVQITAVVATVIATSAIASGPSRASQPHATLPLTRPNIVLILTDDQTMDSIAKMPYVGSERDWIKFADATVENSNCCPSRSTILTGRYDTHTHVENDGEAGRFDYKNTLGVWLHSAGYRTALVGKFLNSYPTAFGHAFTDPFVPPGWTDWQAAYGKVTHQNGHVYDSQYSQYDYEISDNGTDVHFGTAPADYEVNVLASRAVDFIHGSRSSPFFLYFAPTATHRPLVASPKRKGMFNAASVPHVPSFNEANVSDKPSYIRDLPLVNATDVDGMVRREWAAAVSVDDAVKQIDDELKADGVFNKTVEIFLTDNGYAYGEHRWIGKRAPYRESIATPLMIRFPGLVGRSVPQSVTNVDLASTISEMANVRPGLPQDGQSLVPLLLGNTASFEGRAVLLHWPGNKPGTHESVPEFFGVHTNRYTYVEYGNGEKELYDNHADPYELTNVAGQPGYAAVQATLAARLAQLRQKATS